MGFNFSNLKEIVSRLNDQPPIIRGPANTETSITAINGDSASRVCEAIYINWHGNWLASKANSRDTENPSTLIFMMFCEMLPPVPTT